MIFLFLYKKHTQGFQDKRDQISCILNPYIFFKQLLHLLYRAWYF